MKTFNQFMSESVDGLYTYRKPNHHSIQIVNEWMQENQIPNPISPDELHVSVVTSEVALPQYVPDPVAVMINPSSYWIDILGDALVLRFKSDPLASQWEHANALGAKTKWPTYQPHMSLSYDVPIDYDTSHLKPFPVHLILNEEQSKPMTNGFASIKSLSEYTIGDMSLGGGPVIYNGVAGNVPEIPDQDISTFLSWLEQQGIEVNLTKLDVSTLRPSVGSVQFLPLPDQVLTKPLVVSNDNFILDGHSRWRAILDKYPHYKVTVHQIDALIKTLIPLMNKYLHGNSRSS